MRMHERTIYFGGHDVKADIENQPYCDAVLTFVSFEEQLPEPKVIKVSIPAGSDLDITESLGNIGYENGYHTIKFLLWASTVEGLNTSRRIINSIFHGQRFTDYQYNFDDMYRPAGNSVGKYNGRYSGRAKVSYEHRGEFVDLVTIEIERSPWYRATSRDVVYLECHPAASYWLEGSARYYSVRITTQQASTSRVGNDAAVAHDSAVTGLVIAENLYGDTEVNMTVADWLMYLDGEDYVVNSSHWGGISSENAVIDGSYTVTNGDMVFSDVAKQRVRLDFIRYDV